jgi:hypothetical protein
VGRTILSQIAAAGRACLRKPVLSLVGLCALLAGCLAAPLVIPADTPSPQPSPMTLSGIATRSGVPPTQPLRVFFVHGMGTATEDYCALATLMTDLAATLKLQQLPVQEQRGACGNLIVPAPIIIGVPPPTKLTAELYTFNFAAADNQPLVQFSFLLWEPLVDPLRLTLAEDGHPAWAALTTYAKGFIQTHLGDVVLYGGTYRQVMRPAVEKALCYFVGGQPDPADPMGRQCQGGDARPETVLITHSLGGYMLMDAIADLQVYHHDLSDTPGAQPHPANAAAKALARTNLIFMLANQLALLDLTTLQQYPPPTTAPAAPANAEQDESGGMLRAFRRHWRAYHRDAGTKTGRPRQIVAVSDPNDILSFLVSPGTVGVADNDLIVANVYLGEARNWFNLFASPYAAHLNYLTDQTVMNILVCGMTGNTINPCP